MLALSLGNPRPEKISDRYLGNRIGFAGSMLVFDQVDSVSFPRSGWRGSAEISDSNADLGAEATYTRWIVGGMAAYSLSDHTLQFAASGGGDPSGNVSG